MRNPYEEYAYSTVVVLAMLFVLATVHGCSNHIKVFECKLDCADKSSMECKSSVESAELEIP